VTALIKVILTRTVWLLVFCSGVLLLASSALYLFRAPLLVKVSELLIENHPPEETELLLILGGDVTTTVDYAVSIYSKVQPRLILISPVRRANEAVGRLANKHRLATDKILILPSPRTVTSTYEEALALENYRQQNPIQSVTIITAAFHTGRAYWTFRTILPKEVEIRMAGAPEEGFSKSNWWRTEGGLIKVNNEFLKWAYYWWNYDNEDSLNPSPFTYLRGRTQ